MFHNIFILEIARIHSLQNPEDSKNNNSINDIKSISKSSTRI